LAYNFRGGIRPDDHKYTKNLRISSIKDPDTVSIALTQHVGMMCRPVVKAGEAVYVGQLIGDIPGGLGCPVHSSVSGTVKGVEEVTTPMGGVSYNIIIENDHKGTVAPTVRPFGKKLADATYEEILAVIRNSGIAGMGGTAFPTHAKIAAARGNVISVIINCCEGEPFVTVTRRIILEKVNEIIGGIKILMMALGVRKANICIEKNKKLELAKLRTATLGDSMISVIPVSNKYPSGSEKHLVYALTKREIPEGKTTIESGNVVFSAETCVAIFDAFVTGMPLVRRIITLDGDCIPYPANLSVPIGTSASYIIEQCGGLCKYAKKVIFGGPLMGQAQWDINSPITKNTSAVLVFSDYFDRESKLDSVCIRCGRCVKACPMRLMPFEIAANVKKGKICVAEDLYAVRCIECGACSHVCPGAMPLTQLISRAKTEIITRRRNAQQEHKTKNGQ